MLALPRRFGFLNEEQDEVLFRASNNVPDVGLISDATEGLSVAKPLWRPRGRGVVARTLRHTVGWASAWALVERDVLQSEFVSDDRSFSTVVFRSSRDSELNLQFRLKTLGRDGWTGYRLSWRRLGDDLFYCLE